MGGDGDGRGWHCSGGGSRVAAGGGARACQQGASCGIDQQAQRDLKKTHAEPHCALRWSLLPTRCSTVPGGSVRVLADTMSV